MKRKSSNTSHINLSKSKQGKKKSVKRWLRKSPQGNASFIAERAIIKKMP